MPGIERWCGKIANLAGPLTVVRLLVDLPGTTPPESGGALMSSDGGMTTAKTHNHSMKIRGMVRPKGQRGSSWYHCLYRIRRLVGVRAAAAVVCSFL